MGRHGDEALASLLPVLRAALERQRDFRREQLALFNANGETQESAQGDPTDGPDVEAAQARREVDALVAAGARRALADIELALARMRTGRYGLCRSCASPIPVVVLEAIPKTTRCLACQQWGTRRDRVYSPQPAQPIRPSRIEEVNGGREPSPTVRSERRGLVS
jgi:RNA polymerase-binding transcription factor DksA